MSDFSDIRDGWVTIIRAAMPNGFNVYGHAPFGGQSPCAWIMFDEVDYRIAFQSNSIETDMRITVSLSSGEENSGWLQLDNYLSPTGSESVVKAMRDDPTWNGKIDDSVVLTAENFRNDEDDGGQWFRADILVSIVKTIA
jgi:hypothetical protein|tara:strand:- start:430 stop:849 length:420 start_codon:yes stop_codon:yes gene_type:complete